MKLLLAVAGVAMASATAARATTIEYTTTGGISPAVSGSNSIVFAGLTNHTESATSGVTLTGAQFGTFTVSVASTTQTSFSSVFSLTLTHLAPSIGVQTGTSQVLTETLTGVLKKNTGTTATTNSITLDWGSDNYLVFPTPMDATHAYVKYTFDDIVESWTVNGAQTKMFALTGHIDYFEGDLGGGGDGGQGQDPGTRPAAVPLPATGVSGLVLLGLTAIRRRRVARA